MWGWRRMSFLDRLVRVHDAIVGLSGAEEKAKGSVSIEQWHCRCFVETMPWYCRVLSEIAFWGFLGWDGLTPAVRRNRPTDYQHSVSHLLRITVRIDARVDG